MTQIGRNQPCPCTSGKKYKRCCLPAHEAAASETARLRAAPPADSYEAIVAELKVLDDLSNRTNERIKAGDFDEAEHLCDELERRYPDQIDSLDRRALLHEARGDTSAALLWRRKALSFAETKGGFDEESLDWMRQQIAAVESRAR